MDLYRSILDQIAKDACYVMLFLQGEPMMSSNILEMIQMASQRRLYTCISTNGHFMNEDKPEK